MCDLHRDEEDSQPRSGITELVEMLHLAEAEGWSRRSFVPHAGHQLALHASAGLGLGGHETASAPGPFSGVSADTVMEELLDVEEEEESGSLVCK